MLPPSVINRAADRLVAGPDPTWYNPSAWGRLHLPGWKPTWYQEEIGKLLATERKVSVVGPHGLGKSATDAEIILWFARTREARGIDWKVVTTAGAWRQLQHYLWPEVQKWARRLKQPFLKDQLLTMAIKLDYGQAFAVASDDPSNIEGAHADEILYIIDEAKAVIPDTWDAIEGALSAGNAYVLANSTPGKAEGRLFEIHERRPGFEDWKTVHVTLQDAIKAGRISETWAEQRAKQWGKSSPMYLNRVLGEFSTSDSDGVIPLDWLEAANDRWEDLQRAGKLEAEPLTAVAADVASEEGIDKTVVGARHGWVLSYEKVYPHVDTMKTARNLKILLDTKRGTSKTRRTQPIAVVDAIGVGTGAVDTLREQGITVDAFMGSQKPANSDKTGELTFLNRRAEAYWGLRDLLNPAFDAKIAIPGGDDYATLTGDLIAPKYDQTPNGSIKIEEKDDIKKRLGRSPDEGDMVTMIFNARLDRSHNLVDMKPVSLTQTSKWRT